MQSIERHDASLRILGANRLLKSFACQCALSLETKETQLVSRRFLKMRYQPASSRVQPLRAAYFLGGQSRSRSRRCSPTQAEL